MQKSLLFCSKQIFGLPVDSAKRLLKRNRAHSQFGIFAQKMQKSLLFCSKQIFGLPVDSAKRLLKRNRAHSQFLASTICVVQPLRKLRQFLWRIAHFCCKSPKKQIIFSAELFLANFNCCGEKKTRQNYRYVFCCNAFFSLEPPMLLSPF